MLTFETGAQKINERLERELADLPTSPFLLISEGRLGLIEEST